ncbi:MAG: hypothetical protein IPG17_01180 [Sandaracinaceae bacterium]|jgi:recombination associated protein RdgC|nr:hypothetical protein [Sandaracinaceae bacterium]MBP7683313.1 hypothetical protein [Deltaproteobacteria bacterium]MBK6813298.1 hypothetical protein [Sandaracinaceae bacterium]MBK7153118.1 hypothetical protein [Sandaracinaceae bacterium]MBK7773436.1 hypothetical protein [Sandaracinaceae bacterium]
MGLLGGSVSYTRFYVRGDAPSGNFRSRFEKAVAHDAFRPLAAEEEEDERVGWCSIRDPFVIELERDDFLYADHVHLGLRIDRWRVPRNLFKAHYAIAERELMDTQGIHRLSRSQKEDLQVFVMRRLRKQTIPAMRHVELSWELGTGLVRIASTSKPVLAHAVIQFEKTFKLQIAEHGVLTGMERAGFDEARLTKLVALQPARLHAEDEPAKRGAKAEG